MATQAMPVSSQFSGSDDVRGIKLTVTNVGSVTARQVRMADVPPAALALASFKTGTKARVVRGNAVWPLGKLDPGESRVVRGSVRVKSGSPGRKRNLVLATAVNAKVVSDRADTRLLPRRRVAPVTGWARETSLGRRGSAGPASASDQERDT